MTKKNKNTEKVFEEILGKDDLTHWGNKYVLVRETEKNKDFVDNFCRKYIEHFRGD